MRLGPVGGTWALHNVLPDIHMSKNDTVAILIIHHDHLQVKFTEKTVLHHYRLSIFMHRNTFLLLYTSAPHVSFSCRMSSCVMGALGFTQIKIKTPVGSNEDEDVCKSRSINVHIEKLMGEWVG